MVVDASAILSYLLDEETADWTEACLERYRSELVMSTVNLTEVLIKLRDLKPMTAEELEEDLLDGFIRFIPPDVEQSRIAAAARLRYPLNLGDCFVYALAKATGDSIMTLDADFKAVDVPVLCP
jgi:ribonuclease VapC